MNAPDAVAPRDPLQREGQGRLEDPERPLLLRVARDAVLKVERTDRTGSILWGIVVPPDSNGTVTFAVPVTENCDAQGSRPHPGNIPTPPGKLHTVTGVVGAPAFASMLPPPPDFWPW